MLGLFRPSGGVLYHWRARRRRALWRGFVNEIGAWLAGWKISHDDLILIGPSGGYTLPREWIASFRRIHAYDLDPLAPWLFARNHPDARVEFYQDNVFFFGGELSLSPLRAILESHPRAVVLFSNVLGQVPLEGKVTETGWAGFLAELRELLGDRVWASYHDLFTVEPLPLADHALVIEAVRRGAAITEAVPASSEVIDHLMQGWTTGLDRKTFGWSLSSSSLHVIEGVHS